MRITTIIFIVAIIILIVVSIEKKKKPKVSAGNKDRQQVSGITGAMVADTLESLGYFKLADPDKVALLKKDLASSFDQGRVLSTINAEKSPYAPYCRRLYHCDGETLFELGGVVEYLEEVKPTFEKLGIPLTWSDDYFSDDATKHTILVNGKKYTAFEGDPDNSLIWGWAAKNFVEMLNDQLSLHHSDERVYPILGGNDGMIVFLTKPQYDFIFKHFDEEEKPKEVDLWWKQNT